MLDVRSQMMMIKNLAMILMWVAFCAPSQADETGLFTMVSPKLKRFIQDHQTASDSLSEAYAAAFSDRKMLLEYFSTDDETIPLASFTILPDGTISIAVRENQTACDEYLSLLFMLLDSANASSFKDVALRVRRGSISKDDFALEVMRLQFKSSLKAKGILQPLEIDIREKSESILYKQISGFPPTFEEYLIYIRKVMKKRDQRKELDAMFDSIRSNRRSEQDGARQPATATDSKSKGEEKPKPESEGRSQ